jgi:uncharacterized protein (TIGR03067 family)
MTVQEVALGFFSLVFAFGFVPEVIHLSGHVVAADAPRRNASKNELEKFQGIWVAVSVEHNGAKVPDAAIKSWKMVVEGNEMTINPQTDKVPLAFELDPAKSPKEIVLSMLDERHKGVTRRGIYSFEDGLLRLCCDNNDKHRDVKPPKDFSTKRGDDLLVIVAKRDKPGTDK